MISLLSIIDVVLIGLVLVLFAMVISRSPRNARTGSAQVRSVSGIYMAGEHAFDVRKQMTTEQGYAVGKVSVHLPNEPMNEQEKYYALYLLNHPSPDVTLHFTEADLWKHN